METTDLWRIDGDGRPRVLGTFRQQYLLASVQSVNAGESLQFLHVRGRQDASGRNRGTKRTLCARILI